MKPYRQLAVAGVLASSLFVACSNNEPAKASTPAPASPAPAAALPVATPAPAPQLPAKAAQAIVQPAWLRERLPDHTVAYLRVPSIWGLLSAPNGRALDGALASEAHARIIGAFQDAVKKDPAIARLGLAPALTLGLYELDSPLEVAVLDPSDQLNLPTSMMLLSAHLNLASVADFNQRLAELGPQANVLKAPLDAEGRGALAAGGLVRFDAAQRRLFVLAGLGVTPPALDQVLGQLGQTRAHPMHEVERRIDTSGQGLFGWIGLKGLSGLAAQQLPDAPGVVLLRDLLDKGQSLAFGWGTVDGRGRLQVRLDVPQAKLLSYLAAKAYRTDLKTAGKPSWLVSLMLPDAERLAAFENALGADFGEAAAKAYQDAKATMAQHSGLVLADWLKLVGPEFFIFEDANGYFGALRVSDFPALYAKLDELGQRFGWRRETLKVGGVDVQHLTIPSGTDQPALVEDTDTQEAAFATLYARVNNHFYWTDNGPWMLFADVPQALSDRAASSLDTELGPWLKQSQGYAPDQTLVGVSVLTRNAQRQMYHAYLAGLQVLGDMLGSPISLAGMPSARTLQLPVDGALGATLEVSPNHLGLSLGYEQSPAEFILASQGGLMMGAALAGIAAAVAIPAYQDYQARAQVASVLAEVGPMQLAMAEYYRTHGAMPNSDDDLELTFTSEAAQYLEAYGISEGAIVLYFGDQAAGPLAEHSLLLTPYLGADGGLAWVCGNAAPPAGAKPLAGEGEYNTDLPEQYLPSTCR